MRLHSTCLDDDEVLLLLQNGLPETLRAQVDVHLDSCESCRRLVAAAADPNLVSQRDPAPGSVGHPNSSTPAPAGKVDLPLVDLARGTTIDRYLVLGLIGAGGMSKVFLAYDPELDRRVALKLLDPTRDRESLRSRLVREAQALGKLSHPNVVQVYDVGQYPGGVFVAMELVNGVSFELWCRQNPRPPWQEVLAAYLEAAQGLSAAHQAGLVHRDVKPSNLLRGQDGRVRVVDFGLALRGETSGEWSGPAQSSAAQAPHPPAHLDATLTSTGTRVGTPLYMAPEQHQSSRATAASDQYSFCVALYEGLYGVLPFSLASRGSFEELLGELAKAKNAGELAQPPSGSPVPGWVHQVLVRGLAVNPQERYPSMEALISALQDDPVVRRRGRRRRLALGVGGAAVLAFAFAGWAQSGAFRDPCAHPETELVGVWDASTRDRIRTAFEETHRDYAAASLQKVTDLLNTYADAWTTMRRDVCRLYKSNPQRSEDREAREVCLDRRLGQLRALTALLAEKADPAVLNKAVSAAASLVPVSECADVAALRSRVRPPEGPEVRARVSALQPRVDRLEALYAAGHYPEVLQEGKALLEEARSVPYPELMAQTNWWMGQAHQREGDYDAAQATLQEAANEAAEARDANLLAQAWGMVLYIAAEYQMKFDEASVLLRLRSTLLAGTSDERAQWLWQTAEGYLLMETGKFPEARKALEQALATAEKIWGKENLAVTPALNSLAIALERAGELPAAIEVDQRALSLREQALGPNHPDVAQTLSNLGVALVEHGDLSQALQADRRALKIVEDTLGPESPYAAIVLNNIGDALIETGQWKEATDANERALAIREKVLGVEHPDVALSLVNLGDLQLEQGDASKALPLYQRSLEIEEKGLGPSHPDLGLPLAGLGRAQVRLGHQDEALSLLERARALREPLHEREDHALSLAKLGLGELALTRHRPAEAIVLLEPLVHLTEESVAHEAQLSLAEALWLQGNERPRARELVEACRAYYERLHHAPGVAKSTAWLEKHPLAP